MILVSAVLTVSNYLAWSRAIQRALAAKMKLDFIDGTTIRPNENTEEYKRWNRIDSMVTTWILNTISKELVEAFMYLQLLDVHVVVVHVGASKEIAEMSASQQLIQFLVGLNNMYDQARSQILLLEPLPAVMKAFSMLIRMEKQLQVNVTAWNCRVEQHIRFGRKFADRWSYIADIIRTEVRRAMNDEMPMDPLKVNFVHLEEYAGPEE
ncbi:UNVERIFIED_CONTAM: hypothetical protein Sradi_2313000 [Sesamum radiatum]|uniref:Retrotransposon Copia-like N-terminal domain-containing protein n=1 Tax=Sesamum radiatum TaxID=300843 RepID=A0AAW2T5Q6_SESRA